MSWGLLIPIIIVKVVASLPRMAANSVGLCFESKFEIGGRTIERPKHFSSKNHKAAFEDVGQYVGNFLTRDVMLCYQDRSLQGKHTLTPKGIPLEVWHEVLEYFAEQGFIERFWEMRLPPWEKDSTQTWNYEIYWHADGTRIERRPAVNVISGEVPGSSPFTPGLLTEAQKQGLIGTQYALTPTDCLHFHWYKNQGQRYAEVTDDNFTRKYVRNRKILSEKEINAGVNKMATILTTAAALKK